MYYIARIKLHMNVLAGILGLRQLCIGQLRPEALGKAFVVDMELHEKCDIQVSLSAMK